MSDAKHVSATMNFEVARTVKVKVGAAVVLKRRSKVLRRRWLIFAFYFHEFSSRIRFAKIIYRASVHKLRQRAILDGFIEIFA